MAEPSGGEPWRLTATEALRALRAGTLSPAALAESCLARIAERDPVVRAFVALDPALLRRAARRADPASPLGGLPVGVKDVLDTADLPTAYGSPIHAGCRPRADAAAVALLRAAGGLVAGKTVTTEFAIREPGPTRNPRSLAHTPGGSSSGSAAAVADRMVPLAFGTQTAGSIIRPAAFCGIVGFKPSFGLIPRAGMKVMAESLDTIGVLARAVADCALLVGAVSGRDLGDPDMAPPRAPRIGLCRSPSWPAAATETVALWEDVAARLGRAGAAVEQRDLPPHFDVLAEAHPTLMAGETARALAWELTAAAPLLSAGLRDRHAPALAWPPERIEAARTAVERCIAAFPEATAGLDVLVTPAAPGEAPEGLGSTGDPAFNFLWTALRVPCVSVPAGSGPRGLPLGIQIVGRVGEDRAVLAWARWVEAALA